MKHRKFVVRAAMNVTYALTVWAENEEGALESAHEMMREKKLKSALLNVIDDEISVEEAED
jgi:hypothetical protein